MDVGILGGTGPAGSGLAARLAAAGLEVIIGSRSKERAQATCTSIAKKWPDLDLRLEPGETGLPGTSYLKGHFITTLPKARLVARHARSLSERRMRQAVDAIRRAFDPDAPWER